MTNPFEGNPLEQADKERNRNQVKAVREQNADRIPMPLKSGRFWGIPSDLADDPRLVEYSNMLQDSVEEIYASLERELPLKQYPHEVVLDEDAVKHLMKLAAGGLTNRRLADVAGMQVNAFTKRYGQYIVAVRSFIAWRNMFYIQQSAMDGYWLAQKWIAETVGGAMNQVEQSEVEANESFTDLMQAGRERVEAMRRDRGDVEVVSEQ